MSSSRMVMPSFRSGTTKISILTRLKGKKSDAIFTILILIENNGNLVSAASCGSSSYFPCREFEQGIINDDCETMY